MTQEEQITALQAKLELAEGTVRAMHFAGTIFYTAFRTLMVHVGREQRRLQEVYDEAERANRTASPLFTFSPSAVTAYIDALTATNGPDAPPHTITPD